MDTDGYLGGIAPRRLLSELLLKEQELLAQRNAHSLLSIFHVVGWMLMAFADLANIMLARGHDKSATNGHIYRGPGEIKLLS